MRQELNNQGSSFSISLRNMTELQTPASRLSARSPVSLRTPHRRPGNVVAALKVAARSAPYAYRGRTETSARRRPEPPPTPTPPSRVISQHSPHLHRILSETNDKIDVEQTSIPLYKQISNDPVNFELYDTVTNIY